MTALGSPATSNRQPRPGSAALGRSRRVTAKEKCRHRIIGSDGLCLWSPRHSTSKHAFSVMLQTIVQNDLWNTPQGQQHVLRRQAKVLQHHSLATQGDASSCFRSSSASSRVASRTSPNSAFEHSDHHKPAKTSLEAFPPHHKFLPAALLLRGTPNVSAYKRSGARRRGAKSRPFPAMTTS